VTKKLLAHYKVKTPTISYHQHSDEKKQGYILSLLKDGNDLALVSDAGTPGISDPGGRELSEASTHGKRRQRVPRVRYSDHDGASEARL